MQISNVLSLFLSGRFWLSLTDIFSDVYSIIGTRFTLMNTYLTAKLYSVFYLLVTQH